MAKKEVPMELWKFTPLVLKATAGLRLLPGEKAQKLLDKVLFFIFQFAFQKFYSKVWSLLCKVHTPLSSGTSHSYHLSLKAVQSHLISNGAGGRNCMSTSTEEWWQLQISLETKSNKCNKILLTITTGMFLLGVFVGCFDQDAAILRKALCYLIGHVISQLLQGCSFI